MVCQLVLFLFVFLLFSSTNATENLNQSVRRKGKCSRRCFPGKGSFDFVKRSCPAGSSPKRCKINKRRGFRCNCAPKKPICYTGRQGFNQASDACGNRPVKTCKNSKGILGYTCKVRRKPKPATQTALFVSGTSPDFNILRCTTTQLFISVKDLSTVSVGNVIWNTPSSGTSSCVGCNSVARSVVRATKAASFLSTSCPVGQKCVLVDTVYAKIRELFTSALIVQFGLSDFADENLETLFGCSLPTSSRGLRDVLAIRQVSRVPRSCGAFEQKNSDGRCTFSDCFIGTDGDPINCLFCKATCDNGCGSEDVNVPDSVPLAYDFSEPCCIHDKCYTSFFSKSDCDLAFLRDMLASCVDELSDVLNFIPLPFGILGSPLRCPAAANLYYAGVALGGGKAHTGAQKSRLDYEKSDECAAKCPTTQRSGGQGVTTLTVDLKKTSGTFLVTYQMFSIPDGLEVFYEGKTIFTTGGLVSGGRSVPVTFSGKTTVVRVKLSAPNSGTRWDLSVACP